MVSVPPLLVIDQALFDCRALFSAPPTTEAKTEAQRRKPQPTLRRTVTGRHPLLRLIGRDNLDLIQPWIADWTPLVAEWLHAGLSPFVFTHTPNDFFAAEFAQRFHRRLSELVPTLPPLPKMPAKLHSQKQPKLANASCATRATTSTTGRSNARSTNS